MIKGMLVAAMLLSGIAHAGEEHKMPAKRVVLVHGIFQSKWRCFGFLRRDLAKRGVEFLAPSLKPADGRDGIPAMAELLKASINARFGEDERFVVIAFSMGGLVSRHYLQELGGAKRCDGFFSISTPHHGTQVASIFWGKAAEQMRPGSAWLKRLHETENRLGKIPIVSYRTPADLIIIPSKSSEWDRAENISIPCPIHPMMTFSPRVRRDILARLETPH